MCYSYYFCKDVNRGLSVPLVDKVRLSKPHAENFQPTENLRVLADDILFLNCGNEVTTHTIIAIKDFTSVKQPISGKEMSLG